MKTLFEQIGEMYVRDGDWLIPNLSIPYRMPVGKWWISYRIDEIINKYFVMIWNFCRHIVFKYYRNITFYKIRHFLLDIVVYV